MAKQQREKASVTPETSGSSQVRQQEGRAGIATASPSLSAFQKTPHGQGGVTCCLMKTNLERGQSLLRPRLVLWYSIDHLITLPNF